MARYPGFATRLSTYLLYPSFFGFGDLTGGHSPLLVLFHSQLMEMLAALENEDPEMMEQVIAELMKDPAFAEVSGYRPSTAEPASCSSRYTS